MSEQLKAGREPEIIGGDTPFYSPSDVPTVLARMVKMGYAAPDPVKFRKDGVDHTRLMYVALLATNWQMTVNTQELTPPGEMDPKEVAFWMLASANTDLQRLGIGPLISVGEIERTAPLFASRGAGEGKT